MAWRLWPERDRFWCKLPGMPITDLELQALHDHSEGDTKELMAELIQARKALPLAKKLSQLGPLLGTPMFMMELQGPTPPEELYLGILHKKADGTGRLGPNWPLGEFRQDLDALSEILLNEDEAMELKAMSLTSVFERKN